MNTRLQEDRFISYRISPPKSWEGINFVELWQHRNLLFNLVWRDLRLLYSGTWIGALWIILKPLSIAFVMIVVLGIFVKIPVDNLPYSAVVLSGLVPWLYFSTVVQEANNSMIGNSYLLNKVYFPRIILPIIPLITNLVNFLVMLVLVLGLVIVFGFYPTVRWFYIPLVVVLMILLSFGFSLWVSALSSRFRDLINLLPVIIQVGLYLTPTFYLTTTLPVQYRPIFIFNPMVGIIDTMRWMLLGYGQFPLTALFITFAYGIIFTFTGLFLFQRMQDLVADVV